MTCTQAQALITPFINDTMDNTTLEEFLDHMEQCSECKEELEVYFALLTAMKQLDEDDEVSADFEKELENKIKESQDKILRAKLVHIRKKITFFFMVIVIGLFTSVSVSVVEEVVNISEEVKFNTFVIKNEVMQPYINKNSQYTLLTYSQVKDQVRLLKEEKARIEAEEKEKAMLKEKRRQEIAKETSYQNALDAIRNEYVEYGEYSRGYEESSPSIQQEYENLRDVSNRLKIPVDSPMEYSR